MNNNNNSIYLDPKEELMEFEFFQYKNELSKMVYELNMIRQDMAEYIKQNECVSLLELNRIDYKEKYIYLLKRMKEVVENEDFENLLLIARYLGDENYLKSRFDEHKDYLKRKNNDYVVGSTTHHD